MLKLLKKYFGGRRGGAHHSMSTGGNWPRSWWQTDQTQYRPETFGPVFSCVQIIAQEIAKLPVYHYQDNADGSRSRLFNTAASRVLKKPNHYQTRSDFFLYLLNAMLFEGNGYALVERNSRNEISKLYPLDPKTAYPHVDPVSAEVIYRVGSNANQLFRLDDYAQAVPMRDMLHLRVYTPCHPLIGETPITAAAASSQLGQAIENNGAAFFSNQSRPSGILRVPGKLGKEARQRLKESWEETHSKHNQGAIGILSDGAEWQQVTLSAQDADLVNTHRMTIEDVARVFRVPMFMLGDLEKTSFNNVESLTRLFYSGALSFYLEHTEASLDALFNLPPDQHIEFDFEANLRTNFKERLEGLSTGTTGGIYKINEARAKENLPAIEGGDNVFIQQQLQTVEDRANNQALDSGSQPAPAPEPETVSDEEMAASLDRLKRKGAENAIYH